MMRTGTTLADAAALSAHGDCAARRGVSVGSTLTRCNSRLIVAGQRRTEPSEGRTRLWARTGRLLLDLPGYLSRFDWLAGVDLDE